MRGSVVMRGAKGSREPHLGRVLAGHHEEGAIQLGQPR
jgi:hypothetical protein